jgi:predicted amidohydrolase YtcJ
LERMARSFADLFRTAFSLLAVLLLATASSAYAQGSGDERIFFDAKVFTGDPLRPYAEAVAIKDDKIAGVGTRAEVAATVSSSAERIDLGGRTLFPGLIDSHEHAVDGGLGLIGVDATDKVNSVADLVNFTASAKKSGRAMQGDVVVVQGIPLEIWSHTAELNRVFGAGAYKNQPLLLQGMDGHTEWANPELLKRAGITAAYLKRLSKEEQGYYGFGKDFTPNGFLVDAGKAKVDALLPDPDDAHLLAAGRAMLDYNYRLGITAWLDPLATSYVLRTYKLLIDHGELKSEVVAFPQVFAKDPATELSGIQKIREQYSGIANLHVTGIKIFADGVAEYPSQTAHLTRPYKNSGKYGDLLFDPKKFAELCIAADKQNLIIHVHAIGDGAVKAALDGIAAARSANGNSALPDTITHEQFVDPEDFPRFKQLGVISALQLFWADAEPDSMELLKPYIAPEIYKWQYPARSLLDNGAVISGASDWPVSTANPFRAIYEAETRKGPEGVLDISQAMPRLAMFYAYTHNSAIAMNLPEQLGTIAPGKRADLVLLDRDVLTVSPEKMRDTKVLWTMVAGKMVYQAAN